VVRVLSSRGFYPNPKTYLRLSFPESGPNHHNKVGIPKILQTIRARLPHPPLMNPIGEGGGAAWASLYINVLCKFPSTPVPCLVASVPPFDSCPFQPFHHFPTSQPILHYLQRRHQHFPSSSSRTITKKTGQSEHKTKDSAGTGQLESAVRIVQPRQAKRLDG
jgi:hypothetical protein